MVRLKQDQFWSLGRATLFKHLLARCFKFAAENLGGAFSLLTVKGFLVERSICLSAMAYLFNSTGRQVQPGLSFALLDAGYTSHM